MSEAYLVDVLSSSVIVLVAINADDVFSNQDQKQPRWLKQANIINVNGKVVWDSWGVPGRIYTQMFQMFQVQ